MVYRVFVEKKPGLDNEAAGLCAECVNLLGISALEKVRILNRYDALLNKETDPAKRQEIRQRANKEVASMLKKEATDTLNKVLYELSNQMNNAYSRSDA